MIANKIVVEIGEQKVEIAPSQIARSLTPEQFAEIISTYCNSYNATAQTGAKIGQALQETHRTLQGTAVNLLLGILRGLYNPYSDARNEVAMQTCKTVKDDIDSGRIKYQPFI